MGGITGSKCGNCQFFEGERKVCNSNKSIAEADVRVKGKCVGRYKNATKYPNGQACPSFVKWDKLK